MKKFFILLIPVLFYAVVKLLVALNLRHLCLWKALTGHECWGCGMTRAFNALFSGNFHEAFLYNHAIVIVAPILIYLWLKMLYKQYHSGLL